MRKPILFTIILAALCLFTAAQNTRAAVLYGESAVGYDSSARYVYGYGETWTDYELALYYDPEVFTVLLQYETALDSGSDVGYSDPYYGYQIAAYYETFSWAYQQSTTYTTASHHKVRPYYNNGYGYWFDPFNFYGFAPGTYGDWWGLYGYPYNPYNYIPVPVVHPFNTGVSITTPPDCGPGGTGFTSGGSPCPSPTPIPSPTPPQSCNLTLKVKAITANIPETSDLNGATRPAMLGARVDFEADPYLNGALTSDGTWTWSADGNPAEDNEGPFKTYVWRSEGTFAVRVNFTTGDGRCQANATVNVRVTVPSIVSYSADIVPERLTMDANKPCSALTGRDKFTLGCGGTGNPAIAAPGIVFDATASMPTDSISDPRESQVKFVQTVNLYRQRQTASAGFECAGFRSSESDIDSPNAWRVDTVNPYQNIGEQGIPGSIGVNHFANGNFTSTLKTADSPGHPLSIPAQNLSAFLDDRFEMLVFYFVGDPSAPDQGTTQLIGKLEWRWGGRVTYQPSTDSYTFTQVNPSPNHILGQSTRTTRLYTDIPYNPNTDPNAWKQCGGGTTPTPTPTPNPTPFPTPTPPGGGCTGNGAAFVSQTVPTMMDAGAAYNVSVTMKNNCSTTWVSGRHRLGSQNPQDNLTWNLGRVDLPSGVTVSPGNSHTFNFTVVSPSTPGFYNFQWRMVEEGVEWFGEFTPNLVIDVVGSGCDPFAEQDCYYDGGDWDPSTCRCTLPPPCWKCDWEPVY